MKTNTKIRVRYSETDQMGVVHHSQYVNWFEVARTDHMKHLGPTYFEIEKAGYYLPVIGVHVNYHSPARYEDVIRIETEIEHYNGVRLNFKYKAFRDSDETQIVEGLTEHCFTTTAMKPVKLKKSWPDLHEKLDEAFIGTGAE